MKAKWILFVVLHAVWGLPLRSQVIDDGLQYVPYAAAIGLDYCGVGAVARHPLRERIAVAATSYAALTAVAGGMKLTVSERRPDGSDTRSFPSGHAARAFAGAELVRSEYGWQWGVCAYAVATGVSVLGNGCQRVTRCWRPSLCPRRVGRSCHRRTVGTCGLLAAAPGTSPLPMG